MALLIERNVDVLGDISLSQLYVRLTVQHGPDGVTVINNNYVYSSKNAYIESVDNRFNVEAISPQEVFSYNRETDGADVLGLAHYNLKALLTTDIMREIPVLDPSTGEPTYDPSTGEPIMEEVVEIPKWADDSSVFIVDISINI